MAVQWQHAEGPGKITGTGRNGTPVLDFPRLTTGQIVFISVDFVITDHSGPIDFEIIAVDDDAAPVSPNKGISPGSQHVYKRALFRVTKEADPAVGVVEVPFEVNFLSGAGTWSDFTIIGETATEH